MLTRRVRCTKCRSPLPVTGYNTGELQACPGCKSGAVVEVFRALVEPPRTGAAPEAIGMDGESSCFFHPAKKAVLPCDECGRFLCNLCEIELNGRHLCPRCLESGKKKGSLAQLQNTRVLYDSMALALALYPLLLFYLTFITAPMAIYVAIRYWKAPSSVIPRGKWRFVVAVLIACAQLTGWVLVIAAARSK